MTDPSDQSSGEFRHDPIGQISRFIGGALVGFIPIFVATFFVGASSFEQQLVPWAIPVVGIVALPTAFWALAVRKRSPAFSAGLWTGVLLGLLLAGACFMAL